MRWLKSLFLITPVDSAGASAATYVPAVMVSRLLAFLRTLLVARILGKAGEEAFGIYQPALEFINPIVALVMFGAADVAERYASHVERLGGGAAVWRWTNRQARRIILTWVPVAAVMTGSWFFLGRVLWGHAGEGMAALLLLILCAAAVLALALYQLMVGVLRGLRAYSAAAGLDLLSSALLLAFSCVAAAGSDAVYLLAAYALATATALGPYLFLLWRRLGRAELPAATGPGAPSLDGVLTYAPQLDGRVEEPRMTRFAAWSLVRLLLIMLLGFLSIWGVRVVSAAPGRGLSDAAAVAQYAMPYRIAQLLGFIAVTLWASTYAIAARAWSHGRLRRAHVTLFRMGAQGLALMVLAAAGLLLTRGIFAWALPAYGQTIRDLLPGLLAVFVGYGLMAFFSTYADLREQPQRGALLWGSAAAIQAAGIALGRFAALMDDPLQGMMTLSAISLAAPLLLVAPWLLCRPMRFSATGVPLAVLGLASASLLIPAWVVDYLATPILLGAVLFLWFAGLLLRPRERRAIRRWRERRQNRRALQTPPVLAP